MREANVSLCDSELELDSFIECHDAYNFYFVLAKIRPHFVLPRKQRTCQNPDRLIAVDTPDSLKNGRNYTFRLSNDQQHELLWHDVHTSKNQRMFYEFAMNFFN